jgi:phosphatidylserine synthase 2
MKPSYHLVPLRLALWGVIAIPGVREFYDYVSEPTTKRIGTTAWVGTLALAFETLWIWKMAFHGGYFRQPMPLTVYYPWAWSLCAGTVWLAMFFGLAQYRRKSALLRGALNVLFYSIPVALTGMFAMTNKDLEYGKDAFTEWVS